MRSDVELAAVELIEKRLGGGPNQSCVAESLAQDIIARDEFELVPAFAIEAGVSAAIEEIDDATFDAAFDVIQSRISDEIEGQAKQIALRMLRELAAKAQREEMASAG
jgi:hypothetical protein